jgi:capsule polysaccharide export protein KpsE/RkpR
VNDNLASHLIARNGHEAHLPGAAAQSRTPEQEIQHLKATIADLKRDLEMERAKLNRATEGARVLDDRVWELQQLVHKMNRTLGQRILDAWHDLRQVCAEFVR